MKRINPWADQPQVPQRSGNGKNMIRRKLSLAAAVVTATALTLSACSGGGTPAADLTSVSIMAPFLEAQPPAADGAVQKKLEELTGKQVKINWAPNASYED